jgi:hypothetical protein
MSTTNTYETLQQDIGSVQLTIYYVKTIEITETFAIALIINTRRIIFSKFYSVQALEI